MKIRIVGLFALMVGLLTACQKEANVSENMAESFYVRNGNTDIPAFVYGNGASNVFLLVLHGGPGGNGLEYRFGDYAAALEEKYAVVYTDQRNQGNAHGHLVDDDITLDAMVEDVHALVKTLKARYGNDISIFLMGHSWGGTLGSAYMVKADYQHELKGWIEVDGAHDIPMLNVELVNMIKLIGNEEVAAGRNVADWQPMLDFVNGIDINNITFDQTGELNSYGHAIEDLLDEIHHPEGESASITDFLFRNPNNPVNSTLTGLQLPQAFLEEVEKTALTNQLQKITIPTLLQWGKYDFVVPPALGYSAFEEISSPHKYLKVYNHSGHSPMVNEPDLFTQDIITFIESHK